MADQDAQGRDALRSLKHIVVVMMENRSFDHMLGYLSLEGMQDVDGLTGTEFNVDADGDVINVHAFDAEANKVIRPGEALQKRLDPDHSPKGVQKQLGPGYTKGGPPNGGFVRSFIESRKPADNVTKDLWSVPMGYYTSKDVPVYDHLARQYCVCDRWFCSIPGDTWPNRTFAVTGREGTNVSPGKKIPLYDVPAFTRQLDDAQWRWYSHDPATLRLTDGHYRRLDHPQRDNFAYFDRRNLNLLTQVTSIGAVSGDSFLDDAANDRLPAVSWIDPNFIDVSVFESQSNDDHPPSDIRSGQAFILEVYNALLHSKHWQDTMLVVVYDEHGGFYDHVTPPALAKGDTSSDRTYGLRVPALFAGPRVRRHVLKGPAIPDPPFDHTSIVKTILLAFAEDPVAAVAAMPPRVQRAPDLASVLGPVRTDIDDPRTARNLMDAWRKEATQRRRAQVLPDGSSGSLAPDGAGQPIVLTDFQSEINSALAPMRQSGLNP